MKKSYVLILMFLFFVIVITLIGSICVTGNKEIGLNKDILLTQSNKEFYFNVYGYTVDNPNVIVNPYGNSPLTAIVMFETDDYSKVNITIKSKDGMDDIKYTFDNDKYHIIPVYGLYADYNNTVIIESEGIVNSISIKTGQLPNDFEFIHHNKNIDFTFYNSNYPYAVDSNGDVRWYLNNKYYGNISVMKNSTIIIGSDRYDEKGNTISFYKMSLLGKIYNEYVLDSGYYGYNAVIDDKVVVLSDDILIMDIQTGAVIDKISNDGYSYVGVYKDDIVVGKDNNFYVVYDDSFDEIDYDIKNISSVFYNETSNYNIIVSYRFGSLCKTKMYNGNITLINYEKLDELQNIDIFSEIDRIKVVNNTGSMVYLILDKFLDKRIYEIDKIKYINKTELTGRYTIYLKIGDVLYKTDYYVEV